MKKRTLLFIVLFLLAVSLACSLMGKLSQPKPTVVVPPTEAEPQPAEVMPTANVQYLPNLSASGSAEMVRQWAMEAVASSEYGNDDWSAAKAVGVTDTYECGDNVTAWASSGSDSVEWINLYIHTPMYLTEINIVETYNPDQVVKVELIDMQGEYVTVYTAQPKQIDNPCPYFLNIPVSQSDILSQGVRVTIDQSVLGLGWNEIDAVEMVGTIGEGTPTRPIIPTP